jgi:hypothetical protein
VVAQHGGVDAAGQLAQLLDRELGLLARLRDQRRRALRIVVDARLGDAECHRHRDEPLLRAVVEVALDPPALGVGRGDDPLPRGAQIVDAVPQHPRTAKLW